MKPPQKTLFALLIATIALLATGCTTRTADDTSIPWGRPAGWEGQTQMGMGATEDTSGTH